MNDYRDELYHHGIKGQKWGVRRFQNPDGTLTPAGQKRAVRQLNRAERKKNVYVGRHISRTAEANYRQKKYRKIEKKLIDKPNSKFTKFRAKRAGAKLNKANARKREVEREYNKLSKKQVQLAKDLVKSKANVKVDVAVRSTYITERGYQYLRMNVNRYRKVEALVGSNVVGTRSVSYASAYGSGTDRFAENVGLKYKYRK